MEHIHYEWTTQAQFVRKCKSLFGWSSEKARAEFQALLRQQGTRQRHTMNGTTLVRVEMKTERIVCLLSFFNLIDLEL